MPGAAPEVHERFERVQVEGAHHGRRTQQAEAVHAGEKLGPRLFGAVEVVEDRAAGAEHLLPPRRRFPHRAFEVAPEPVERVIGVKNVAGKRARAGTRQILARHGGVGKDPAAALEQPQRGAPFHELPERARVGADARGKLPGRCRACLEQVKHAHADSREQRFRPPEGVQQIEDGGGIWRGHR